jgi:aspartyl-tRNA(Asn)/glutamyl-tRNA(Gln) amidotransferase subunit A
LRRRLEDVRALPGRPSNPESKGRDVGEALSASTERIWITEVESPPAGRRLAVKDLFDTAGLRTTYGSIIFAEHVPERSAEAVRRLETAGYSNVGKTNLHEFAYGVSSENPHFGTVPNPLAEGRIAGGSSGGSAAALAAGLVDAALGSDSAGSIRIPAACCGVVGFKPTFGLVPIDGCFPLAPSFDHAGPMASQVAECVRMMEALVPGFEPRTVELADLEVGVAWLEHADPLVRARVGEAAALFPSRQELELDLPDRADWGPLFRREALESHVGLFPERAEDYGEDVRESLVQAESLTEGEVGGAKRVRARHREQLAERTTGLDLLLTPTLPVVAPPLGQGDRTTLTKFTALFNLSGWPALAVPCGLAEDGLPASIQIAGRSGEDALVLAAGAALERALFAEPRT